jgi:hypothetical protein
MNKTTVQRFFELVHVIALSAWFGTVGMSGIVAATVFPIVGQMRPTLGSYPEYSGDHALLAGGLIAGKVFLIVDSVQFVCAAVALASFVTMIVAGYSISSLMRVLRSVVLLCTMGLLSYHLFMLMPGMTEDLRNYWDLAAAGNTEQADVHKNAFMMMHKTAATTLKVLMAATLLSLVLAVWTGVGSAADVQTNKPSIPS